MLEEGQRLLLPPEIRILQSWNGLGWEMVWDKGRDTFQQSLDTSRGGWGASVAVGELKLC